MCTYVFITIYSKCQHLFMNIKVILICKKHAPICCFKRMSKVGWFGGTATRLIWLLTYILKAKSCVLNVWLLHILLIQNIQANICLASTDPSTSASAFCIYRHTLEMSQKGKRFKSVSRKITRFVKTQDQDLSQGEGKWLLVWTFQPQSWWSSL